jgi:hypothetical protein
MGDPSSAAKNWRTPGADLRWQKARKASHSVIFAPPIFSDTPLVVFHSGLRRYNKYKGLCKKWDNFPYWNCYVIF